MHNSNYINSDNVLLCIFNFDAKKRSSYTLVHVSSVKHHVDGRIRTVLN